MKFCAGDKVWLVSGSPNLIVLDYHVPTGVVWVAWYDDGIQVNEFYVQTLRHVKPTA
jgi:uncharacterized protein YodC (DUF2158 family)